MIGLKAMRLVILNLNLSKLTYLIVLFNIIPFGMEQVCSHRLLSFNQLKLIKQENNTKKLVPLFADIILALLECDVVYYFNKIYIFCQRIKKI